MNEPYLSTVVGATVIREGTDLTGLTRTVQIGRTVLAKSRPTVSGDF
ncbi:MAG: hypothetical protein IGS48_03865 [Oscillatoriales cyanobacterium C42_A2020_001]|nr:hypothetical protein [Leptolyngbyaceae cyanobacterium C42_A2020_001]